MPRKVLAALAVSMLAAGCSTLPPPSDETAGIAVVVEARDPPTTTEVILRDLGSGTGVIPKRM